MRNFFVAAAILLATFWFANSIWTELRPKLQSSNAQQPPRPTRQVAPAPARAPATWRSSWSKDKLTDQIQLLATAQSRTSQTTYELSYACGEKGEKLEIATFNLDGSPKNIPWLTYEINNNNIPGMEFPRVNVVFKSFRMRVDTREVKTKSLMRKDYTNAGVVGLFDASNSEPSTSMIQGQSIIIADIFSDDQIELAIDFPQRSRQDCMEIMKFPAHYP